MRKGVCAGVCGSSRANSIGAAREAEGRVEIGDVSNAAGRASPGAFSAVEPPLVSLARLASSARLSASRSKLMALSRDLSVAGTYPIMIRASLGPAKGRDL